MNARGGYKLLCVERGCLFRELQSPPLQRGADRPPAAAPAAPTRAHGTVEKGLAGAGALHVHARRQMIIPIRCFTCGKVRALTPRAAVPRLFPRLTAPSLLPPWFRR